MNFKIPVVIMLLVTTVWSQSPSPVRDIPLPRILRSVLLEVKGKTSVPILLPSELPSGLAEKDIQFVYGEGDKSQYRISLYYEEGIGDAGFAGFFGGEADQEVPSLGREERVALAKGVRGYYLAVSCGGSCVPATLMWKMNGVLYTVQFKNQAKAGLVAVANSAILAGKR